MKCILFDLDGTIIDSSEGVTKSVIYAFDRLGINRPPKDQWLEFIGPPLHVSFPAHGIPKDQVQSAIHLYKERYDTLGKNECRPYNGIIQLLDRLSSTGHTLCVATSKPEEVSHEILTKLNMSRFFVKIVGATEDESRSDKDAVLRYLLSVLSYSDRNDAVLVGDTIYDVKGASRVGLPCIGVTWGFGKAEDLMQAGACAKADTMKELYSLCSARFP